ncbi:energy transducer TonB [Chryseobacterium wanjuense]
MKKILLFVLFLCCNLIFSQETKNAEQKAVGIDPYINKADQDPIFPGGMNAFRNNIMTIFDNSKVDIKGTARSEARFLIDESGYITKIVVTGDNKSFNKELDRTIKSMQKTKWKPAMYNNQPTQYWFRFPMAMNSY